MHAIDTNLKLEALHCLNIIDEDPIIFAAIAIHRCASGFQKKPFRKSFLYNHP